MHSHQLDAALAEFASDAARYLQTDVDCGSEVPFEVEQLGSSRAHTPLYCYRPLTSEFIGARWRSLSSLDSHARAIAALERFGGLDRYLGARGAPAPPDAGHGKAQRALWLLLEELFDQQTDFELSPQRLERALAALARCATLGSSAMTLVATLHGMTICSPALALAAGLRIVRPAAALEPGGEWGPLELPAEIAPVGPTDPVDHLLVVLEREDDTPRGAVAAGRAVLRDLLSALRLFGDGRVTLGELAWLRITGGRWQPAVLGDGGRPEGMLVVTAAQEDELRAFCSLVSRRRPEGNEVAWALDRFELGCARAREQDALSDYLLALRALLEPEGSARGALAARLATLCALPERRAELAATVARAIDAERALIAGRALPSAGLHTLIGTIASHLRALLRDVICGHLEPDLAALADELLAEEASARLAESPAPTILAAHGPGAGDNLAPDAGLLLAEDLEDQLRLIGMHG